MSTITQSEIVAEIIRFGMHDIGVGEKPDFKKLQPLSLQDMLDAVRQAERDNAGARSVDGTRTFQVVPDDRLTAAVYAWLHYCAPGNHDEGDDDDAIVHLTIDGVTHGLVKWARRTGR